MGLLSWARAKLSGYKTQKNNNAKKPAAKPKSPEKTRKAVAPARRSNGWSSNNTIPLRSEGYNTRQLSEFNLFGSNNTPLFAQPGARSTNKNRLIKANKGSRKEQKQLEKEVKDRIEQEKRLAKAGFVSYSNNFEAPAQKPTPTKPGRARASVLFGSRPEPNLNNIFGLGKPSNRNITFNNLPRSATKKQKTRETAPKAAFRASQPKATEPKLPNFEGFPESPPKAPSFAAKPKGLPFNLAALYRQDPFANTGLPPGAGTGPFMSPKPAGPTALNRQIQEQQEILAKLKRKINVNAGFFTDEDGQRFVDAVNALKPLFKRRNSFNPPTGKILTERVEINAEANKIRRTLKNRAGPNLNRNLWKGFPKGSSPARAAASVSPASPAALAAPKGSVGNAFSFLNGPSLFGSPAAAAASPRQASPAGSAGSSLFGPPPPGFARSKKFAAPPAPRVNSEDEEELFGEQPDPNEAPRVAKEVAERAKKGGVPPAEAVIAGVKAGSSSLVGGAIKVPDEYIKVTAAACRGVYTGSSSQTCAAAASATLEGRKPSSNTGPAGAGVDAALWLAGGALSNKPKINFTPAEWKKLKKAADKEPERENHSQKNEIKVGTIVRYIHGLRQNEPISNGKIGVILETPTKWDERETHLKVLMMDNTIQEIEKGMPSSQKLLLSHKAYETIFLPDEVASILSRNNA